MYVCMYTGCFMKKVYWIDTAYTYIGRAVKFKYQPDMNISCAETKPTKFGLCAKGSTRVFWLNKKIKNKKS